MKVTSTRAEYYIHDYSHSKGQVSLVNGIEILKGKRKLPNDILFQQVCEHALLMSAAACFVRFP